MHYDHTMLYFFVGLGLLALCLRSFLLSRRDQFRCDIRAIRDSLFDYMVANKFSFDDPGYTETRDSLNGVLRVSNQLNFIRFCLAIRFCAEMAANGYKPVDHVGQTKNQALKQKLIETRKQAESRIIVFVFLEGYMWLVVNAIMLAARMFKQFTSVKQWASNKGEEFFLGAAKMGTGRPKYC